MIILLTNDDGIDAPGLKALHCALEGLGELWVVAPVEEQSGVGHAFSINGPLRVIPKDHGDGGRWFAVDGTPADAVKLAVRSLLPEVPVLVMSGVNRGENTGVDLLYSGTVAAAREASVFGIPAVAVSLCSKTFPRFSAAAAFARRLAETMMENGLPRGTMLNVNFPPLPPGRIRGVRITHQAASRYEETVRREVEPRGMFCHWESFTKVLDEEGDGSDVEAVRQSFVSVTPVHHRLTDREFIAEMADWRLDGLLGT